MKKAKILVACHKPAEVPNDGVYTPIHVGRSISKFKNEMQWMIGDDTGDNISDKNSCYCELTAQYWAWKNLKDVEYIGLAHYRRFFQCKITNENIDKILGDKYDVILCRPIYEKYPIDMRLKIAASEEDSAIFFSSIKRVAPEYYKSVYVFFSGNKVIPYNMFVMKKDEFDKFAEWQFRILFDMERYVRLSPYTRTRRIFGYYAEMLLPIYCYHNNLKILYQSVVSKLGDKDNDNTVKQKIRILYNRIIFALSHPQKPYCGIPCRVGLKQDGIECLMEE